MLMQTPRSDLCASGSAAQLAQARQRSLRRSASGSVTTTTSTSLLTTFTRKEDQLILTRAEALPAERIMGVETGGCPHTAIREDASMNLSAIDEMNRRFPDAELCFIESGGDHLAATFSPELADLTIDVMAVAEGEKIPRKGGPGITRSDLLVINKIDLAPLVGADLAVMQADALRMRQTRPFIFTNLKSGEGVEPIAEFIIVKGGLEPCE